MDRIEDRRNATRLSVNCEIYCRQLGSEELHEALCVTLSGSGVSFISSQAFEVGTTVEVRILQQAEIIPVLNFFIVIARCQLTEDGSFEVGASIQLPEEKDSF
jgi:hypothetical protein